MQQVIKDLFQYRALNSLRLVPEDYVPDEEEKSPFIRATYINNDSDVPVLNRKFEIEFGPVWKLDSYNDVYVGWNIFKIPGTTRIIAYIEIIEEEKDPSYLIRVYEKELEAETYIRLLGNLDPLFHSLKQQRDKLSQFESVQEYKKIYQHA